MNENELVPLKLTVGEWQTIFRVVWNSRTGVYCHNNWNTFWRLLTCLERQLDEIPKPVDAKEKT